MKRVLLHLSDTHFGVERAPVCDALLRLCERQRPVRALLTGDVTQRARRAEFAAAASYLECLEMPVTALPGNHDVPLFNLAARVLVPYQGYEQALQQPLAPEHEDGELLVIGVNTTRWWRHTDGEVSPEQIEHVSRRLRAARPKQLRVVMTHQPVHVIEPRDEHNLLRGHAAAVRAWSAAGADLILGGHIHLPYWRDLREAIPELPRSCWIVQAGTAVSRRVRFEAPNSVNLIRYDSAAPRRVQIERWDYDGKADAFRKFAETQAAFE